MLLVASFFGKCFVIVFLGILKEMCGCFLMGCVDCIVRDCVLSLARVPPPLTENNRFAIIFSLSPTSQAGNYSIPVLREGVGGTPTPAASTHTGYLAIFFPRILYTTSNTSDVSAVMHSKVMTGAISCMRKAMPMMRTLVDTMMKVAREWVKPASSR